MARRSRKPTRTRNVAHAKVPSLLRSLDRRGLRIEQILPTLATKDDLKAFATKDSLEGFATKDDGREEGERSRRYMLVLHEDLVGRLNQHLDAYAHHDERLATHEHRLDAHETRLGTLDLRVRALAKPKR